MRKRQMKQHKALVLLTLITHERTVILVCLLTLQRSRSLTISFLLNTRQLSLLTYDEDKAVFLIDLWWGQGTAQKLFAVVRWKCRGHSLVWNWFLFWGFLWWLSAHHFSFQSTRTNQSAVYFSILLNSTWKSTLTAGYRMKQKNGNGMLQVIYRLLLSKFNHGPLYLSSFPLMRSSKS